MSYQTATAERLRKLDKGSLARAKTDKRQDAQSDRVIPIFENMARRGQITAEQRSAGERYAHFWYGARKQSGLVSSYGDQRWSSTSSSLSPEEWPIHCANELARAAQAIGDPQMVTNLNRIVELDSTLEDIGRLYLGYQSSKQAMASGATLIKSTLARLVTHFGYQSRGAP